MKNKKYIWVLLFLVLSFCLQIWQSSLFSFQGDDFASIQNAENLGMNPNGILYYVLLRIWLLPGFSNEIYLRLLSILISLLAIPIAYNIGKMVKDETLGLIFAGIISISPYFLNLSLLLRNYSTFSVTSMFILLTTLKVIKNPNRKHWIIWSASAILLLTSHILSVFYLGLLGVIIFFRLHQWPDKKRKRLLIIIILLSGMILMIFISPLGKMGWPLFQSLTDARARFDYQEPAGLRWTTFAKFFVFLYFFVFGHFVYPLSFWLVIPGILLLFIILMGIIRNYRNHRNLVPMLLSIVISMLLMLIGFDSIVPARSVSLAPRHLTFVWPAIMLLQALGIDYFFRMKPTKLAVSILYALFEIICFSAISFSSWSYLIVPQRDWRSIAESYESYTDEAIFLLEGKSNAPVFYYLPPVNYINVFEYEIWSEDPPPFFVLMNNNFDQVTIDAFNSSMDSIEEMYQQEDVVSIPPFTGVIYAYSGTPNLVKRNGNGFLDIPVRMLPGLLFDDLRIPFEFIVDNQRITSQGAIYLSHDVDEQTHFLTLEEPAETNTLILVSNVIPDNSDFLSGEQIAEINLFGVNGKEQIMPITFGQETDSWDGNRKNGPDIAYSWHKRIALTGQYYYPGGYLGFNARIFSAAIPLEHPFEVHAIQINYKAETGTFFIWGLGLEE